MATRKTYLTRRELAAALDVNMDTIAKWAASGMPTHERGRGGRPSRYEEAKCRAWLEARREAQADNEPVDLTRERARRERAQARLAEQQYAARAKQLLPADEVRQVWAAEIAKVRTRLLAMARTEAARIHRAGTLHGVPGVERELKAVAYEILRELAAPDEAKAGEGAA